MTDIFKDANNSLSVELVSINKTAIHSVAASIIQTVDDGEKSALDALIQAKGLEELSKMIVDGVKGWAMDEAEQFPKNESRRMGVGFAVKNLPNKYDYSHDERWCELKQSIEALTAQIKEREKSMVEAMKYGGITTETGYIPAAKIAAHGGLTIQVSIPKE
jgi:hypothetical protein